MAPEVVNAQPYQPESDVWSLGCLLYELCAMKKPFSTDGGQMGIMSQILTAQPADIPKSYSLDLDNLVKQMLTKDMSKRPNITKIMQKTYIKDYIKKFD